VFLRYRNSFSTAALGSKDIDVFGFYPMVPSSGKRFKDVQLVTAVHRLHLPSQRVNRLISTEITRFITVPSFGNYPVKTWFVRNPF
jgi:hypothetical protein